MVVRPPYKGLNLDRNQDGVPVPSAVGLEKADDKAKGESALLIL